MKTRKKSVLLLIDQRARDAQGMLLVYYYLKHFGVTVYLCNRRNMLRQYEAYRPDLALFGDTSTYFSDWCRYMASHGTKIALAPQEGAIDIKEMAVNRYRWNCRKPFLKGVSKVFLWGRQTAQWLLEEGLFEEEQIFVTGTPRTDIYRTIARALPGEGGETRFGFALRGESVNPPSYNPIEVIDMGKYREGGVACQVSEGKNWEDYMWHEIAQMRLHLTLVDKVCAAKNSRSVVRPDPFEDHCSYRFLLKKYPNLELNTSTVLAEFIARIDCLITDFSTTGIDALLSRKPVITFQKIMGERLLDHQTMPWRVDSNIMQLYWQPRTLEEACDMFEKVKAGTLDWTPVRELTERRLKDFYDWPRSEPSSLTMAQQICHILEEDPRPVPADDGPCAFAEMAGIGRLDVALRTGDSGFKSWLYKKHRFLDLVTVMNDVAAGKYKTSKRSEFYPWNTEDLARAKKVWLKLQDEGEGEIPSAPLSNDILGAGL